MPQTRRRVIRETGGAATASPRPGQVHAGGDIQLLGLHVVGLDRIGVGRRAEQHASVRLQVEGFVEADQHRPVVAVDARRRGEDEGRAALGLQAQRADAGQPGDGVAPGARCVDQHRRAVAAGGAADFPGAVDPADLQRFVVAQDLPLVAADAAQVALVQGVGIDVGAGGVVGGAEDLVATQHRHDRAGLFRVQQAHLRHQRLAAFVLTAEFFRIVAEVDHHFRTRAEQRMLAEAGRRVVEEGPAGGGERAHLGCAVGHRVVRGGAAGGVVAGLRLALQHHDPAVGRQPVAGGCAGDAGTDDEVIRFDHAALLHRAISLPGAGGRGRWPGLRLPGPGRSSGRTPGAGIPDVAPGR